MLDFWYVSDQSSITSAVLIFHHFVFTYLLFLAVGASTNSSEDLCSRGYMLKNGKCEGKKAWTSFDFYESSICKLRSSFDRFTSFQFLHLYITDFLSLIQIYILSLAISNHPFVKYDKFLQTLMSAVTPD